MFYKSSSLGMTGMDMNAAITADAEGLCTRTELCDICGIVTLLCVVLHAIKHLVFVQVLKDYMAAWVLPSSPTLGGLPGKTALATSRSNGMGWTLLWRCFWGLQHYILNVCPCTKMLFFEDGFNILEIVRMPNLRTKDVLVSIKHQ